jgi:hypothetical protein
MLEERLRAMQFEVEDITYDSYMKKLKERQAVVEERIMGEEFRSPSVQLRITPLVQPKYYRRMTSFSVAHPGKAIWAACSLPIQVTLR